MHSFVDQNYGTVLVRVVGAACILSYPVLISIDFDDFTSTFSP